MIKDSGTNIIAPPKIHVWNMREMLVKDPDGHIIRVFHRIEYDPEA